MSKAHTQIPWKNATTGPTMHGYRQPIGIAQKGTANLVAGIFEDVNGGLDTAKANAALIVRAVNSHEALVKALVRCCASLEELSEHCESYHVEAIEEARAALKLAKEGE